MKKKKTNNTHYYTNRCELPLKSGNGIISTSLLQDDKSNVLEYSLAYINHRICIKDNGRVIGYDNAHGKHHRHIMGHYELVEFISYKDTVNRFEKEWREYHEKK
jgi:hypothetical protein